MVNIKKLVCILTCIISLFSVGCMQDVFNGEYPNKIIVKDNQGKQVEIIIKKDIENFGYILKYDYWKQLDDTELDLYSDISIVEIYKSSSTKSRTISFNRDSKKIKLIIDDKYTSWYEVEDGMYDEIYDNISTILNNDYKID